MSKVTVIITTYPHKDRDQSLSRCLDSVLKQSFTDFDILILENHVDDSQLRLKSYTKPVKVITNPAKKLSQLFNICWKNADTDLLAYLADDVEVDSNWLQVLIEELGRYSDVAVATGPIVSTCYPAGEMHRLYLLSKKNIFTKIITWPYFHFCVEDNPLAPGRLFKSGAYSLGAGLEQSKNYVRQEIDLATTSSMLIRKSAIEAVSGFDEHFNFNHADGDLFVRLKKAGYKIIFNPQAFAYHHMHLGPSRNAYFIGKDTAFLYKKHIRPKSLFQFIGVVLNTFVLIMYWLVTRQFKGVFGFVEGLWQKN